MTGCSKRCALSEHNVWYTCTIWKTEFACFCTQVYNSTLPSWTNSLEQITAWAVDNLSVSLRIPCFYGTRCTRSPPMYDLCPCLAQYRRTDVFGMWVGFIESERVFLLVTTELLFCTTVFLFMESG